MTKVKREIKFRAWDKRDKEMINIKNWYWFEELGIMELDDENGRDYIFMQFTGLKDKKGKEIYEGDIIKTSVGNEEVEWLSVGWSLLCRDDDIKVIGNIYENPNLLNPKK